MSSSPAYAFGPYVLMPARQLLLRDEAAVRIGCRAFDLLTALVERPGLVVTKRELIARAWPDTTVEDDNLKVNIAALRRTMGDDPDSPNYIATVTGRGYRFVAEVHLSGPPSAAAEIPPMVSWTRHLSPPERRSS